MASNVSLGESSNTSNASNSNTQQLDPNNYCNTGFTKKQYKALQAMLGIWPVATLGDNLEDPPNPNPQAKAPFGRP